MQTPYAGPDQSAVERREEENRRQARRERWEAHERERERVDSVLPAAAAGVGGTALALALAHRAASRRGTGAPEASRRPGQIQGRTAPGSQQEPDQPGTIDPEGPQLPLGSVATEEPNTGAPRRPGLSAEDMQPGSALRQQQAVRTNRTQTVGPRREGAPERVVLRPGALGGGMAPEGHNAVGRNPLGHAVIGPALTAAGRDPVKLQAVVDYTQKNAAGLLPQVKNVANQLAGRSRPQVVDQPPIKPAVGVNYVVDARDSRPAADNLAMRRMTPVKGKPSTQQMVPEVWTGVPGGGAKQADALAFFRELSGRERAAGGDGSLLPGINAGLAAEEGAENTSVKGEGAPGKGQKALRRQGGYIQEPGLAPRNPPAPGGGKNLPTPSDPNEYAVEAVPFTRSNFTQSYGPVNDLQAAIEREQAMDKKRIYNMNDIITEREGAKARQSELRDAFKNGELTSAQYAAEASDINRKLQVLNAQESSYYSTRPPLVTAFGGVPLELQVSQAPYRGAVQADVAGIQQADFRDYNFKTGIGPVVSEKAVDNLLVGTVGVGLNDFLAKTADTPEGTAKRREVAGQLSVISLAQHAKSKGVSVDQLSDAEFGGIGGSIGRLLDVNGGQIAENLRQLPAAEFKGGASPRYGWLTNDATAKYITNQPIDVPVITGGIPAGHHSEQNPLTLANAAKHLNQLTKVNPNLTVNTEEFGKLVTTLSRDYGLRPEELLQAASNFGPRAPVGPLTAEAAAARRAAMPATERIGQPTVPAEGAESQWPKQVVATFSAQPAMDPMARRAAVLSGDPEQIRAVTGHLLRDYPEFAGLAKDIKDETVRFGVVAEGLQMAAEHFGDAIKMGLESDDPRLRQAAEAAMTPGKKGYFDLMHFARPFVEGSAVAALMGEAAGSDQAPALRISRPASQRLALEALESNRPLADVVNSHIGDTDNIFDAWTRLEGLTKHVGHGLNIDAGLPPGEEPSTLAGILANKYIERHQPANPADKSANSISRLKGRFGYVSYGLDGQPLTPFSPDNTAAAPISNPARLLFSTQAPEPSGYTGDPSDTLRELVAMPVTRTEMTRDADGNPTPKRDKSGGLVWSTEAGTVNSVNTHLDRGLKELENSMVRTQGLLDNKKITPDEYKNHVATIGQRKNELKAAKELLTQNANSADFLLSLGNRDAGRSNQVVAGMEPRHLVPSASGGLLLTNNEFGKIEAVPGEQFQASRPFDTVGREEEDFASGADAGDSANWSYSSQESVSEDKLAFTPEVQVSGLGGHAKRLDAHERALSHQLSLAGTDERRVELQGKIDAIGQARGELQKMQAQSAAELYPDALRYDEVHEVAQPPGPVAAPIDRINWRPPSGVDARPATPPTAAEQRGLENLAAQAADPAVRAEAVQNANTKYPWLQRRPADVAQNAEARGQEKWAGSLEGRRPEAPSAPSSLGSEDSDAVRRQRAIEQIRAEHLGAWEAVHPEVRLPYNAPGDAFISAALRRRGIHL
jgi:hypothetical protein